MSYDAGLRFFKVKREWVLSAVARQQSAVRNVISLSEEELVRMRAIAGKWLPARLSQLSSAYGFEYSSVTIKNNRSNWGSCSGRGNINLNLKLMVLPEPLRDYVILHELCHLRHRDHGRGFHALLENLCSERMHEAHYEEGDDEKIKIEVLRLASKSRASFPVSHLLEKAMKTFRIA